MATSCLLREFDGIDGSYEIAERSRLGLRTDWSCRRGLSGRQSIVFIIEHDIGDIHISTTRVDEVSHPDTIAITITSDSDDCERWIDHLDPRGKWKCTTMKRLSSISIDILRGFPRAPDSGYDHTLMRWDTELFEGVFDRHDDEEVSATGTPLDVCQSASHK